jgi:hypothetical protein
MATMLLPLHLTSADLDADHRRRLAAHLAHLAGDLLLPHRLTQSLPWEITEALLSIARQDPGLDQDAARLLVQQALRAIIGSEILASRRAA